MSTLGSHVAVLFTTSTQLNSFISTLDKQPRDVVSTEHIFMSTPDMCARCKKHEPPEATQHHNTTTPTVIIRRTGCYSKLCSPPLAALFGGPTTRMSPRHGIWAYSSRLARATDSLWTDVLNTLLNQTDSRSGCQRSLDLPVNAIDHLDQKPRSGVKCLAASSEPCLVNASAVLLFQRLLEKFDVLSHLDVLRTLLLSCPAATLLFVGFTTWETCWANWEWVPVGRKLGGSESPQVGRRDI